MVGAEHDALWARDPRATPFQSGAWLNAWWSHLGGGERHDLIVRDDTGAAIASLPMFVWRDGDVRRLVPVGAGHSDYSDALVDPLRSGEAIAGLWRAIAGIEDRWDELLLPDLRPDSPLLASLPDGWISDDAPSEVCPVLPLAGPDVLGAMSRSRRRKIVHDRNRASALGNVMTRFAAPDEISEALDALFGLHAARWEALGETGVLADPRVQAFHRAAAPALATAGLLRLAVVRHGDRIVSVLLALADRRSAYSYAIGNDLSIPGQSFGTLAFLAVIDRAAQEGAASFDFLRGEEPYKYAWGAQATRTVRRTARRLGAPRVRNPGR
ncbi:MAG: GNAT family N-acetyltransferase [Janthinobacterium lividum]